MGVEARIDHPRLLVGTEDYAHLRDRARGEPWRSMRETVRACTSLSYSSEGSVYQQYSSMTRVMQQAALAVILFPQERQLYTSHIIRQLSHWDDLNTLRRQRPRADWASMINGGDAFFSSILALDLIHDDLSPEQLAAIEARLQTWYEYERDVASGGWYLAKYGAMGLWALYKGDMDAFGAHAAAYDRRLRQHFTADGVALVGGNYASARLAGGELAKTYFMDILTRQGWYDYYGDPLLGSFYEWFYAGMLTPTRHFAIFQDCRETAHSGTGGAIANHRAHRFSKRAAAHAAWLQPTPPAPGLLSYVLIDEALPEPRAPASRLWESGYAALWQHSGETALMTALWAPNRAFHHDHYEVNSIHVTGYGHTLLRNPGYEGWGNPPAGFSWEYLSGFDLKPEWDHAVGGNILYVDPMQPHHSKAGGGLVDGVLHEALDSATGDAGEAVTGARHQRTTVLVKQTDGGALPYVLLFDDVTRVAPQPSTPDETPNRIAPSSQTGPLAAPSTETDQPVRIALHPASLHHHVITPQQEYRWDFGEAAQLIIFLATPATAATRLKRGGLSQFPEPPMYLHAEYEAREEAQILTVLFPVPAGDEGASPRLQRLGGEGYTGVHITHSPTRRDIALAAFGQGPIRWNKIVMDGSSCVVRYAEEAIEFYHARKATRLTAADTGFEAQRPISLTIRGFTGQIHSPGSTTVSFFGTPRASKLLVDGSQTGTEGEGRRWTVSIPSGAHRLEWVP